MVKLDRKLAEDQARGFQRVREEMRRMANRHNLESNAQIIITQAMVDAMPADLRVKWHSSHDGQRMIEALIKALIKLGVINCEEVVYKHINQGGQTQAVQEGSEKADG